MRPSSSTIMAFAGFLGLLTSWAGAPLHAAGPFPTSTSSVPYQESGKVEAIDYSHDVISINDRGYVIPIGTPVHTAHGTASRNSLHIGSQVGFNSEVTSAGLTVTGIWILNGR